jgi:peroxiredoxin Q/BCP
MELLNELLKEGTKAPNFELVDSSGKLHKLTDYFGKKVILYFYPKDDTPGCTKQACDFTEHKSEFDDKNAVVIGISADDSDSHAKFEEKFCLSVILLSDMAKVACKAYGVVQMKEWMGRRSLGIERTTYLIDEYGTIKKVFPKVRPEGHWETLINSI